MRSTLIPSVPHPAFQSHNVGEGLNVESSGVSHYLGHLVKTIVGTCLIKDSHVEEVDQGWIIDFSPIQMLKPLRSSNHMGPGPIIPKEVRVHVVRATLPPSMLFADRALLRRGYSISEPNTLVETVSKPLGLTLGLVYNPSRLQLTRLSLHSIAKWE